MQALKVIEKWTFLSTATAGLKPSGIFQILKKKAVNFRVDYALGTNDG